MSADLAVLEARLGHVFRDRELLGRALTHRSKAYEAFPPAGGPPSRETADNERLEFLGDSILGFLVSESLLSRHPSFPEGRLSKTKAHLVSATHLFQVAQDLGLGEFLFLGRGEEMSGGREKRALLADGLEALMAALYLDGGLEVVRSFVEARVIGGFDPEMAGAEAASTDFKSALQELAQAMKFPQPRYLIIAEEGPEHSKTFTVEVRLGKDWSAAARGLSKKSAGQQAAQLLLEQMERAGKLPE